MQGRDGGETHYREMLMVDISTALQRYCELRKSKSQSRATKDERGSYYQSLQNGRYNKPM
jgi:hypothetical protein